MDAAFDRKEVAEVFFFFFLFFGEKKRCFCDHFGVLRSNLLL